MRDPRCLRMTFGGFPGLEIQKTQGNDDVLSFFMAGELFLRRQSDR